jgi:hypothetical protein
LGANGERGYLGFPPVRLCKNEREEEEEEEEEEGAAASVAEADIAVVGEVGMKVGDGGDAVSAIAVGKVAGGWVSSLPVAGGGRAQVGTGIGTDGEKVTVEVPVTMLIAPMALFWECALLWTVVWC